MYNSSPADCANALAVTSMTDYDGKPGGLSTPPDMTNGDDTYTDFSNFAAPASAGRVVSAPGAGATAAGCSQWDGACFICAQSVGEQKLCCCLLS